MEDPTIRGRDDGYTRGERAVLWQALAGYIQATREDLYTTPPSRKTKTLAEDLVQYLRAAIAVFWDDTDRSERARRFMRNSVSALRKHGIEIAGTPVFDRWADLSRAATQRVRNLCDPLLLSSQYQRARAATSVRRAATGSDSPQGSRQSPRHPFGALLCATTMFAMTYTRPDDHTPSADWTRPPNAD